jgi:hypothetical protein
LPFDFFGGLVKPRTLKQKAKAFMRWRKGRPDGDL